MNRFAVACGLVLVAAAPVAAQREAWTRPFPAHRVIGNLYAVGTYDLGVFLITSEDEHILINTGLEDSTPLIRENIESLGFQFADVKILLSMQAHWDHTAALGEIREITGAQMWAAAGNGPVLEDGGFSDPHFGGSVSFTPVSVDRIIADGEVIELGETRLTVLETPGHTAGSSSYTMRVREDGRDYAVVIANMGTINPGKQLVVDPTYPGVAKTSLQRSASRRRWRSTSGSRRTARNTDCTTSTRWDRPTAPRPLMIPRGFSRRWSVSRSCTWSRSPRSGADTLCRCGQSGTKPFCDGGYVAAGCQADEHEEERR